MRQTHVLGGARWEKRRSSRPRLIQRSVQELSLLRQLVTVACGFSAVMLAMAAVGEPAVAGQEAVPTRVGFGLGATVLVVFAWLAASNRGVHLRVATRNPGPKRDWALRLLATVVVAVEAAWLLFLAWALYQLAGWAARLAQSEVGAPVAVLATLLFLVVLVCTCSPRPRW